MPLPPIAEQRRIAGILDQADDLRGKRRHVLAQLDTLTQSIFFASFGDVSTWPTQPLRSLVSEFSLWDVDEVADTWPARPAYPECGGRHPQLDRLEN